jgi:hypothetical protein
MQLREDTRAAAARPMNSLHMGPAVQHAAARVHVRLHHVVAASMASLRCAWDAWRAACPGAAPGPFHVLHSRSGVSCELRLACLPMSMPTRSHHRFIQQAQPVQRAHLRPSGICLVCLRLRDERPAGQPQNGVDEHWDMHAHWTTRLWEARRPATGAGALVMQGST